MQPFLHLTIAIRNSSLLLAATMAVLSQAGCATTRMPKVPPPPSEEIRANFGTIGIVIRKGSNDLRLDKPMDRSTGAAAGAGSGALQGLAVGSQGGPFAPLVWVISVPLGAIVGSAVGAAKGVPRTQRDQAEKKIRDSILKMDLRKDIADEILRVSGQRTKYRVVVLQDETKLQEHDRTTNSAIDTFLELHGAAAGLAKSAVDKKYSASLQVSVGLIRARDNTELYSHTWLQRSGQRTFLEWADGDGRAISQELSSLASAVAENVVEELFLMYEPANRPVKKR